MARARRWCKCICASDSTPHFFASASSSSAAFGISAHFLLSPLVLELAAVLRRHFLASHQLGGRFRLDLLAVRGSAIGPPVVGCILFTAVLPLSGAEGAWVAPLGTQQAAPVVARIAVITETLSAKRSLQPCCARACVRGASIEKPSLELMLPSVNRR